MWLLTEADAVSSMTWWLREQGQVCERLSASPSESVWRDRWTTELCRPQCQHLRAAASGKTGALNTCRHTLLTLWRIAVETKMKTMYIESRTMYRLSTDIFCGRRPRAAQSWTETNWRTPANFVFFPRLLVSSFDHVADRQTDKTRVAAYKSHMLPVALQRRSGDGTKINLFLFYDMPCNITQLIKNWHTA